MRWSQCIRTQSVAGIRGIGYDELLQVTVLFPVAYRIIRNDVIYTMFTIAGNWGPKLPGCHLTRGSGLTLAKESMGILLVYLQRYIPKRNEHSEWVPRWSVRWL